MALNPLPMPIDTALVDQNGLIEFTVWVPYFVARDQQLAEASVTVVHPAPLTSQAAAIGATPLSVGSSGGLYRVNVYARITQAATASSSLTPTFRWTEGVVAQSRTYTALTGNTTTTILVDVFPLRIDANTALTYETAYASVGATPMQYSLEIAVERLA
jgi:hypothetical protein